MVKDLRYFKTFLFFSKKLLVFFMCITGVENHINYRHDPLILEAFAITFDIFKCDISDFWGHS